MAVCLFTHSTKIYWATGMNRACPYGEYILVDPNVWAMNTTVIIAPSLTIGHKIALNPFPCFIFSPALSSHQGIFYICLLSSVSLPTQKYILFEGNLCLVFSAESQHRPYHIVGAQQIDVKSYWFDELCNPLEELFSKKSPGNELKNSRRSNNKLQTRNYNQEDIGG